MAMNRGAGLAQTLIFTPPRAPIVWGDFPKGLLWEGSDGRLGNVPGHRVEDHE